MPRTFAPGFRKSSSVRKSLTVAAVLFIACCATFGLTPFTTQTASSQEAAPRTLSLAERARYQRAVEEVYWRHTVWPQQNARPKPSLDEVAPPAATRAKVEDVLRKSEALARVWSRPVTAEQLQAELSRMARETRRPELLRELWQALGNDPFLVAEVLARPALVERLTASYYASDERFHGALRAKAEEQLRAHKTLDALRRAGAAYVETESVKVAQKTPRLVGSAAAAGDATGEASALELSAEEWNAETARLRSIFNTESCETCDGAQTSLPVGPVGVVSGLQQDADSFYVTSIVAATDERLKVARVEWPKTGFDAWWSNERAAFEPAVSSEAPEEFAYQLAEINQAAANADDTWTPTRGMPVSTGAAVWTGSEMIVWGGRSGARYNLATNTWTPTAAVGAPSPRGFYTAVWTGTEMIVWGGCGQASNFCGLNDGARYNPATDSWTPTSTTNAPGPRRSHAAVWTGSKMIVFGGCWPGYNNSCSPASTRYLNSGGVYDPATDTWTPTTTDGAPAGGFYKAVWTGTEMLVWNGEAGKVGGRYNPNANRWAPISTLNRPSPRTGHSVVWTGTEMIVWGGSVEGERTPLNDGGRYNPSTDTWTFMTKSNAPLGRAGHTAVWTGAEMIVYGGDLLTDLYFPSETNTGARYNPSNDTWTHTSKTGAPVKSGHVAVWTGTEMIVWSISNNKEGARYSPASDTWVPTDTNDSPESLELGVWTGAEMIVWSRAAGCISGCPSTGALYNPATYSWRPMSVAGAPDPGARGEDGTAVWTGTEMIFWGNYDGGRYNPRTDAWARINTTNAPPAPRAYHTAVWSGTEMIVWGGSVSGGGMTNTGARYNPASDSWAQTSIANAPAARYLHSATWADGEMIVWGGVLGSGPHTNTGGRYNPQTDSWTATSTANAPEARRYHTAVWTGTELVVWGGRVGDYSSAEGIFNTGGRYNPRTDAWTPTSTAGAPSARFTHTAVWTGSLMVVWGGQSPGCYVYVCGVHTGARYNPAADAWTPTGTHRAPGARYSHLAFWTGDGMIVWGGVAAEGSPQHGAIYTVPGASPNNTPPAVRIDAPAAGATFDSGADINITATATDADGGVTSVHFYAGNTLVGSDTAAPFAVNWRGVRGGSYSLTAVATDNGGAVTRSQPVAVTVNASTTPPVCAFVSPTDGATYAAPASIPFEINAQSNRDRTISTVEVFDGTFSLGKMSPPSPYTFNYGGLGAGTYTFNARCTDSAGAVTNATPVVVTVGTATPATAYIAGNLADSRGAGLANVRVRLDGPAGTAPLYVHSNSGGGFKFDNLKTGEGYTVTPESTLYTFDPPSRSYGLTQNQENALFTATNPLYAITGRITDNNGQPVYPATINLSGSKVATTGTDVNGNYYFFGLAGGGTYTVQPYKNGYVFTPATRTFNSLSAEQTADFTAAPETTTAAPVNVAAASNGGTVTVSSAYDSRFTASSLNNGDRKGLNWGTAGGGWNDATGNSYPDWVEVAFNGEKTINEVGLFTVQDAFTSPSEPTEAMTFSKYGVTAFEVRYWTGTAWAAVPNATATGNRGVWRRFTFPALTTAKLRVVITGALDGYSRLVEVEAWQGAATPTPTPTPTPAPTTGRVNVALASNGATAAASSQHNASFPAAAVINGDRKGLNWGSGGGWNDATSNSYPDWLEVTFGGAKTINEVDLYTLQDAFSSPVEPTEQTAFSLYGVTSFEAQYWTGAAWAALPGGIVTGNNKVWRKLTFAPVTTTKIRVVVSGALNGSSRLVEVEAWQADTVPATSLNHALASNGATVAVSSIYDSRFPATSINDGDRKGLNWGSGGGWNDATANSFPDWVEVTFNSAKTLTEVDVFTVQDNFASPSEPTEALTFTKYGVTQFDVQAWDGAQWVTVSGGSVTGNDKVWRKLTFAPVTTTKIRVLVRNALGGHSRITEVEAY